MVNAAWFLWCVFVDGGEAAGYHVLSNCGVVEFEKTCDNIVVDGWQQARMQCSFLSSIEACIVKLTLLFNQILVGWQLSHTWLHA